MTGPRDDDVHLISVVDGRRHDLNRDCWCHPMVVRWDASSPTQVQHQLGTRGEVEDHG